MLWVLLLPILMPFAKRFALAQRIAGPSRWLQKICIAHAPISNHRIHAAVVCGGALPMDGLTHALRATAIVHLFMVSGMQIWLADYWLKRMCPKIFSKYFFSSAVVLILVMASGFHAGPVRTWISLVLADLARWRKLRWTSLQRVALSGVTTWLINPIWITSYGLVISWGGALAVCLSRKWVRRIRFKSLIRQIVIYFLMTPLLLPFSIPHPIAILCNWLFAPTIGIILFPLSLACFFLRFLCPLFNAIWSLFAAEMNWISVHLLTPMPQLHLSPIILWTYVLSFHLIYEIRAILRSHKVEFGAKGACH